MLTGEHAQTMMGAGESIISSGIFLLVWLFQQATIGSVAFPKNVREFQSRFSSEEACQAYLAACRWPEGTRLKLLCEPVRRSGAPETRSPETMRSARTRAMRSAVVSAISPFYRRLQLSIAPVLY
jgi:hypothetical protein